MHSMLCNFDEFVLKLDQKLYIENSLNQKWTQGASTLTMFFW